MNYKIAIEETEEVAFVTHIPGNLLCRKHSLHWRCDFNGSAINLSMTWKWQVFQVHGTRHSFSANQIWKKWQWPRRWYEWVAFDAKLGFVYFAAVRSWSVLLLILQSIHETIHACQSTTKSRALQISSTSSILTLFPFYCNRYEFVYVITLSLLPTTFTP